MNIKILLIQFLLLTFFSFSTVFAYEEMIDNFDNNPEKRWIFFADTVMGGKSSGNVTFTGSYDDSSNATGYFWESNLDGLLSNQSSFTTNSLSPGEHTITFQAQYSGSTTGEIDIAPPVESTTGQCGLSMKELDLPLRI